MLANFWTEKPNMAYVPVLGFNENFGGSGRRRTPQEPCIKSLPAAIKCVSAVKRLYFAAVDISFRVRSFVAFKASER